MESGAVLRFALRTRSEPHSAARVRRGCREYCSGNRSFGQPSFIRLCFVRRILLSKQRDERVNEANSRRGFLQSSLIGGFAASLYPSLGAERVVAADNRPADVKDFELNEVTIDQLQAGMKSGKYTARS